MFDELPASKESLKEPKLSLKDYLLAETPLGSGFVKPYLKFTKELFAGITDEEDKKDSENPNLHPALRGIASFYVNLDSRIQNFCDSVIARIDQAEANSLKYQVGIGVIKEPTEEQKVKIAKATN